MIAIISFICRPSVFCPRYLPAPDERPALTNYQEPCRAAAEDQAVDNVRYCRFSGMAGRIGDCLISEHFFDYAYIMRRWN
jgi:hypothetical protein